MVSTDDLGWTYCCSHLMACVDRPKMLLQTFITTYVPHYTVSSLRPPNKSSPLWAPQIPYQKLFRIETLMEMLRCENWIIQEHYIFFSQYLISHAFSTNCQHCYILRLKKLTKQTILNINTQFTIRTTYVEFQTSTTIMPQGILTSDRETQEHICQWKHKDDCSSSAVSCVIYIIWMTVTT